MPLLKLYAEQLLSKINTKKKKKSPKCSIMKLQNVKNSSLK